LIVPFDIFCQQEVKLIYNQFLKAQQVTSGRGTTKAIFRPVTDFDNINLSSHCNLTGHDKLSLLHAKPTVRSNIQC